MRLPNGYGSVIKMSGKRRKPYAVRVSDIIEYVDVYAPEELPKEYRYDFKRVGLKWSKSKYTAVTSDSVKDYVIELPYTVGKSFKQKFRYVAFFEKSDTAYSFLAEMNNNEVVGEHQKYTETPTFAEMYEKWKRYKKSLPDKISPKTWRNYDIAFNHLVDLHHKKFNALRTEEIQNAVNKWTCKSGSTVSNIRTVINNLYKYSVMNGYVDRDKDYSPFVVYSWVDNTEQIHSRYTNDEIALLWSNLYVVNNVDLVLITIYTGLRPTELLEITTDNVHIEEKYMIGGIKTNAGIDRTIPIADKILPLIKNRYNKDRRFLVNNRNGNHYTYKSYLASNFNKVMSQTGLQHLPHDGRHTFASLMDDVGANDVCIKLIMGHSMRNDVTKGTYTHKTLEQLLAEVNKI